ncbi:MAG: c-type heme family protein [Rubrivivax sp.]
MKLLVKFNLIFLLVFVLGLAVSSLVARSLLQRAAQEEVADRARLLLEQANVVSAYTGAQIRPLLETQMKYSFLPQSVPSYSAAEVLAGLQKAYPEYGFKSAMLNPTNPRDRAVAWEEDVISKFRAEPDMKEFVSTRDTPTGASLFIARPIRISNPDCLICHSTPDAAPKTLVDRYGPSNGFGWKLNDILGAQVVSVPMAVPLQRAERDLTAVVGVLAAVFLAVGATLNLMLWKLVIQPVSKLAALADRVSLGEPDVPEFVHKSSDEIGVLAESFGRMRKSLAQAMKMLDG